MSRFALISLAVLLCAAFTKRSAPVDRPDDPEAVAWINGEPIATEVFKQRYVEYLLRTGMHDSPRVRRAVLEQLINDRLLVSEALEEGMDKTPAYTEHVETVRMKLSIEFYLEHEVLSQVAVSEADLEEAFVRLNTTLTARHLFARTRAEADRLYERLSNGESFELLAKEVFVDTTLANSGGSIGTFSFDETDPDFEDAAFGLAVGEISTPVRTAQGYSIIQVTDRFTHPILTETKFAERKSKLNALLLRKKRIQARSHFLRRLADELDISFHEPAFGQLLGQITGLSLIESSEAMLGEPLVSFAGGTWTVDAFRIRAARTDPRYRAAVRTAADLEEFITGLILREELLARASSLQEHPTLDAAVRDKMHEWILEKKKTELAQAVTVSEEDVRQRYESDPSNYRDAAGAPLPYKKAAPNVREMLRAEETKTYVLDYVAELRDRYDVEIRDDALHGLSIAGRRTEG